MRAKRCIPQPWVRECLEKTKPCKAALMRAARFGFQARPFKALYILHILTRDFVPGYHSAAFQAKTTPTRRLRDHRIRGAFSPYSLTFPCTFGSPSTSRGFSPLKYALPASMRYLIPLVPLLSQYSPASP
jgi:hypothetical protein